MRRLLICVLLVISIPISLSGQGTATSPETPGKPAPTEGTSVQPNEGVSGAPSSTDEKNIPESGTSETLVSSGSEPFQPRGLAMIQAQIAELDADWKQKESMYEMQIQRSTGQKTLLQNRFQTINHVSEQKIQALSKQGTGASEDKEQIKLKTQQIQAEKQAEIEKHRQLVAKADAEIQEIQQARETARKKFKESLDALRKEEEAAKTKVEGK